MDPLRTLLATGAGRRILVGRRFRIVGASRIRGRLFAGVMPFRLVDVRRGGMIRIDGSLECDGHVDVTQGNQWFVDVGGTLRIGDRTMFSPDGRIVVRNLVTIGAACAIGWETQIVDDNQHPLTIDGVEHAPQGVIAIGDRVWIGSRVSVLKDTVIGDGCVVAAGAVVKGDFSEPDCLIGGVPARVIRRGVSWRFERDGDPAEPVLTSV